MLLRLLIGLFLVAIGAAALVVAVGVALDGPVGGAAFAALHPDSTTTPSDIRDADAPTSTVPVQDHPAGTSTTSPAPGGSVPAPSTTSRLEEPLPGLASTTTAVEPPAPGLHDIPDFVVPEGFAVEDQWTDGPSRLTLWGPVDDTTSVQDAFGIATPPAGSGWTVDESGETETLTWARFVSIDHPWCIWVEIYGLGSDVGDDAPTFLVVESPFCDVTPGAFA